MPFEAEHVARLEPAAGFRTFRRQPEADGVDYIYGLTENGEIQLQSVRFDAAKHDEQAARAWLDERKLEARAFGAAELVENRGGGNCLEHMTANAGGCEPRYEELEGRKYLVVPMIMLTEGVHQGSRGPLYYPPEELAKTPAVWNTKPVVVYHPKINGVGVSACTPEVLSASRVGMVMGARFEGGKLKAEAWLDDEKMDRVDPRIRQAIKDRQVMEISTGLFTDNEPTPGEWRGERYTHVAKNYRPDHLALLPDETGACSAADGAGLLRNQETGDSRAERVYPVDNAAKRSLLPKLDMTPEKACKIMRDGEVHGQPLTQKQKDLFGALCGKRGATTNADDPEVMDLVRQIEEDLEAQLVENVRSFNQTREALQNALTTRFGNTAYVEDVYPKFLIYCRSVPYPQAAGPYDGPAKQELYRLGYTQNGDGVQLADESPVPVNRVMEYQTQDGKYVANAVVFDQSYFSEEPPMASAARLSAVSALIANAAVHWDEDDREFLLTLQDEHFDKLVANAAEPDDDEEEPDGGGSMVPDGKKPGQNKDNEMVKDDPDDSPAQNAEQYIASAPPGIREVLQMGYAALQAQRKELITAITANKANKFTPQYLAQQDLAVLQGIAALAQPVANAARPSSAGQRAEPVQVLFNGAAGAVPTTPLPGQGQGHPQAGMVLNGKDSKPLSLPRIDFSSAN